MGGPHSGMREIHRQDQGQAGSAAEWALKPLGGQSSALRYKGYQITRSTLDRRKDNFQKVQALRAHIVYTYSTT